LYFDRALNVSGNRAEVVVIFLEKKQYLISVRLQFRCTNNTIEYEGCIISLKVSLELRVGKLEVYGDSY
jgi:ribonuclease HI